MQTSAAKIPRWWLWPTILSLDAPAVVLLWQALIARSGSVATRAPEVAVLGCSVWLAYSADRWIEGWRLVPENIRTHRHRFHQTWRWPIAAVWAAVLGVDVATAVGGLSSAQLRSGALMLLPVCAYLLSHQLVHRHTRWRAPKEACVAILLGAGAALFAACRPGADLRGMAVPLGLFVLLCFSNCALISVWEDEVDLSHGETSLALQFGRSIALSKALPWAISAAAGAVWVAQVPHAGPAAGCAAVGAVLLGLVDMAEPRIGRVRARVLADVALMTPVVLLLSGSAP